MGSTSPIGCTSCVFFHGSAHGVQLWVSLVFDHRSRCYFCPNVRVLTEAIISYNIVASLDATEFGPAEHFTDRLYVVRFFSWLCAWCAVLALVDPSATG